MKFKNIAITGASGLLGRETVKCLEKLAEVTPIDINNSNDNHNYHHADVLSLDSLETAFKNADAVVHLAALQLDAPEDKIFSLNTIGTWNVLQVAQQVGIKKVILVSSECATGLVALSRPSVALPDYLPVDEQHPLKPNDAYGCSKETMEAIGKTFSRWSDMKIVVLRPTTVYGVGMEEDMRQSREIDDPYFWLYVEICDVVEAIRLGLDYEGPDYDCFFVSAEDTFSPKETLPFIKDKYGFIPEIRNKHLYANRPYATIYDNTRAKKVLGLEIKSNWRRYLGEPI
ncbi:MAG: UDP-glucose 4-epimerase [Parasphingorhabdus sp.]|jgi:UDP-glucose 4-epimerase